MRGFEMRGVRMFGFTVAGAAAVLAVGFGEASVYARPARPQPPRPARPHPPKLRAGESWSYVVWKLIAQPEHEFSRVCNEEFGVIGTQTCDGHYDSAPFPQPGFGGWGFNGGHNGTSKATHPRDSKAMTITFFAPGAEIDGSIPGEASDRYTVTDSQGPGGWKLKSPAGSQDYDEIAPGKKGGPLHLKVTASHGPFVGYDFEVYGYVVVERSAGKRRPAGG